MDLLIQLGISLLFLLGAYFIGKTIEQRHFSELLRREEALRELPVMTLETLPSDWVVMRCGLVQGSVVISVDYFKRFLAQLRALVGGRIRSYEPLLDRARREALVRMTEEARRKGFNTVINVRLETSRLASSRGNERSVAGVEMLAYGTGLRLRS